MIIPVMIFIILPSRQNHRNFECRINKNALPQTVFWAILPTG